MKKVLVTHLYYGDPSEEFSLKLAQTLVHAGADILEIGIPYTDPICDGEIFQRACQRALIGGITPLRVIGGIREIREKGYKQPIYLTSYYGPIFKLGVSNFVKKAKEVGVTGLIVPDILLEEQEELREACDRDGLSLIQFATVYSAKERLKEIIKASTDFIYCVSLSGVTGDRGDFHKLVKLIKLVKSMTKKKIYVGFGIKSKEDAREIVGFGADGVIIGSAIAQMYEGYMDTNIDLSLPKIAAFIKSVKMKGEI